MKLWRGGGQDVAHSNDEPYPQGSSVSTFGEFREIHKFMKNGIIDKASNPDPTVETIFINVKPSVAR